MADYRVEGRIQRVAAVAGRGEVNEEEVRLSEGRGEKAAMAVAVIPPRSATMVGGRLRLSARFCHSFI